MDIKSISMDCTRPEFVGTAVLDTIGLVIPGVDDALLDQMDVGTRYRSLGVFSSRTGAAGQLTAIDEAVKATNTEVLSIELPRDTKGWGGHGNYVVLGGQDVSDVRQAKRGIWNLPFLQMPAMSLKKHSTQSMVRHLGSCAVLLLP